MKQPLPKFDRGNSYITIFRRKSGQAKKKGLRCVYCGKLLFRASGEVMTIVDTKVAENPNAIEVLCDRCNTFYYLE